MASILEVIKSDYIFDYTPCGNGFGSLAMKGRLISVVDLALQSFKWGLGSSLAIAFATTELVIYLFGVGLVFCMDVICCRFSIMDKKYFLYGSSLLGERLAVIAVTATIGILIATIFRVLNIVGNAIGIFVPEVGQCARSSDRERSRELPGNLFIYFPTQKQNFIYLFPHPWILTRSAIIGELNF